MGTLAPLLGGRKRKIALLLAGAIALGLFPGAAQLPLGPGISGASASSQRSRIGLDLTLVRRGVLSATGTLRGARGFERVLVLAREGRRWTTVRRAVPLREGGRFSLQWKLKPRTSVIAVRAVALGGHGKRLVSEVTTLRIGARGSAAYSVPATTRIYSGEKVRSAEASPSGRTIVELSAGSEKPVVGGHLAVGPSSALPFGMFGSVVRVSGGGPGWTVALKPAPIDQVLGDVSMHLDEDVTPHVVDARGRTVDSSARPGTLRISGRASFARTSGASSVFDCKTSGRKENGDRAFVSAGPMPISIELSNLHALDTFDTGSFFPHRDPFFLMQVHGEAKASIGFEAKKAFSCELSDSFRRNHRLAIPLGAVGPVPVTMYLEPTLKFEVSASGSVSLSQRHYWAITLEQNGFSPFKSRLAHSADPVKLQTSAALDASLFAGGDLSVMFGAGEGNWAVQAGIYGAFGPDFTLGTSTDRPGCLTATAKLEANLGIRLQVLVKRWSPQLASLTTAPVDLGGPWCVGGNGGGGSEGGGGSTGGGAGGSAPAGALWAYEWSEESASIFNYDLLTATEGPMCVPSGSINGRGIAYDPADGNLWYSYVDYGFEGDGYIHKVGPPPGCLPLPSIPFGDGPGGSVQDAIGAIDVDPADGNLWVAGYQPVDEVNYLYKVNKTTGAVMQSCYVPFAGDGEGNDTLTVAALAGLGGSGTYLLTDGGEMSQGELMAVDAASCVNGNAGSIANSWFLPLGVTGVDYEDGHLFVAGDFENNDTEIDIYDLGGPPFDAARLAMSTESGLEDISLAGN